MHIAIEITGWAAAVLLLCAYGLLSAGKIASTSRTYQLMNIAGSAGFVINSGWNGAIPSATLNVIWLGIGLYALWKLRAAA